jgi:hypothetical protein
MARVGVHACDVCGKWRDVEIHTWTITPPDGGRIKVDLCEKHEKPLTEFLALRGQKTPQRSRRGFQVVDPEDIPRTR